MLTRRQLLGRMAAGATLLPWRITAAATAASSTRPGFGLAAIADWSPQLPFLDQMKTARPWIGHLPGQWGGRDFAALQAGGWLDAQGWPRAIPPDLAGIGTILLTDLPAAADGAAGHYVVTWQGQGRIELSGRARGVRQGPQTARFDFTPGDGGVVLTITASEPADPLREIRVIRADRQAAAEGGALFNPDWLERIRGTRLLRFMDWGATNNSPAITATDRPLTTDFSWAWRGVPIEVTIALANELAADPWFCLPHQADDDHIRTLAQLAHAGLRPDLRTHVEYSNEVWNFQFAQAHWAEEQARARWGQEWKWVQYYALRAAEAAGIWAEVFADAPQRLVRVLATQTGWKGLEADILTAPLVMAEGRPAPATAFDAWAVAGYFGAHLANDENAVTLRDMLAASHAAAAAVAEQQGLRHAAYREYLRQHRFDQALTAAAAVLADGGEGSLRHLLDDLLPHHAAVARAHGLQLLMYEGGSHATATGALLDEEEVTEFLVTLNYTPAMGALYRRLLAGWQALTPAPFNAYVDVATPGKWGSWGALRHLGDDNPRWQALTGA